MRLLWVPHGSWLRPVAQRDQFLIHALRNKHDICVITWHHGRGTFPDALGFPIRQLEALVPSSFSDDGIRVECVPASLYPRTTPQRTFNRLVLERMARKLHRELRFDAVVFGPAPHLFGCPDLTFIGVRVFDYLDFVENETLRRSYLRQADATLCVTRLLQREAMEECKKSFYLPNGVDPAQALRFGSADIPKSEVTTIGLVGLTLSPRLFIVDAMAILRKRRRNARLLVAGEGPIVQKIARRSRKLGVPTVLAGWIPWERISECFLATSVGVYPVDKNPYFDRACPIKILEYSLFRRPVVSTDLAGVRELGFPNVRLAEPTAEAFADEIEDVIDRKCEFPVLTRYTWANLAHRLETILWSMT